MEIPPIKSKKILLSPLNWGLGHVARTIPIIQSLLEKKNEIIVFCNSQQKQFYIQYFPDIKYIQHPDYPFKFKGEGKWVKDTLFQFFPLYKYLKKEREIVDKWIKYLKPDLIISDQRFGFYSSKVRSIIISHQLNLPVSKWTFLVKWWNSKLLLKFDEIWVPDNKNRALSGSLSQGKHQNIHFIGIASRFQGYSEKKTPIKYENLGIVSGPEPYNQQFLTLLIEKLSNSAVKSAIIYPSHLFISKDRVKNIDFFSSILPQEFEKVIYESDTIISRAGYSTLMDLKTLDKKAILIPTPGQAEQEYLSNLHQGNSKWIFVNEKTFKDLEI